MKCCQEQLVDILYFTYYHIAKLCNMHTDTHSIFITKTSCSQEHFLRSILHEVVAKLNTVWDEYVSPPLLLLITYYLTCVSCHEKIFIKIELVQTLFVLILSCNNPFDFWFWTLILSHFILSYFLIKPGIKQGYFFLFLHGVN